MIKPELELFKDEVKEKFKMDSIYGSFGGDYEKIFAFDDKAVIDSFIVTTDKDNEEGQSSADFVMSETGKGMFTGVLDTRVPKDGITKRTGYCQIKSAFREKSFKRRIPYEWNLYTHMIIRCRGDGRPYSLSIGMDRYFDVQWNDQYTYPLYTHGGPYWQLVKIPFSKFILTSKGRVQDKQRTIVPQLDRVAFFGITVGGDNAAGPFHFEIDYIALVNDLSHTEEFGYEMYRCKSSVHS